MGALRSVAGEDRGGAGRPRRATGKRRALGCQDPINQETVALPRTGGAYRACPHHRVRRGCLGLRTSFLLPFWTTTTTTLPRLHGPAPAPSTPSAPPGQHPPPPAPPRAGASSSVMPFRSRTSLVSGTGSSTKQDDRHVSSLSVEKLSNTIALSPLSPNPEGLPLPATHRSLSLSSRRKKKTRIDASAKGPLRVHWERLMRRMGAGTAPSSSSNFDDSTGDSSGSKGARSAVPEDPDAPLDEVVVEREWADDVDASLDTRSDQGISPDKSGGSNHLGGTNTDHDSFTIHPYGFWGSCMPLIWIRWRVWPFLLGFFWTRFLDEKSEEHYNKENWFLRKVRAQRYWCICASAHLAQNLAVWSALFYILNWTLATAFNPQPFPLPDIIFYYCVMPVLTFPLIVLVIYDWPRDRNITYQIALSISTWSWGVYQLVFIRLCDFYRPTHPALYSCQGKDFLSVF